MLNQSHPTRATRGVEVPPSLSNWRAERFGRVVHVARGSLRLIEFRKGGPFAATFDSPKAATQAVAAGAVDWHPWRRTRRVKQWGKPSAERAL